MRLLFLICLLLSFTLPAQELYFPPTGNGNWETLSLEEAGFCDDNLQDLYDYLENTNTDAFLLLKDGKIVLERYFGDFTANSPHVWNSAGKSLMAFTVGIAADLDSIELEEPTSTYLGAGWTNCPETEAAITVRHQLTMTSGLSDDVEDVYCTDPECLVCLVQPGERWAYHNGPYTLLGDVIEAATGVELNDFIRDNLRSRTGMTGQYIRIGYNRNFVSNARSMARFGLLNLNRGVWAGDTILRSSAYFTAMTTPSQSLNPAYGYLWWLNGQSSFLLPGAQVSLPGQLLADAPTDAFSAVGLNSQLINVVPSQGIVMVRMGDAPGPGLIATVYNNRIWQRVNALSCTTSTAQTRATNPILRVYPSPASDHVVLVSSVGLRHLDVFANGPGRVSSRALSGNQQRVPMVGLPSGILNLRVTLADGSVSWRRVVKARRN